LLKEMKIEEFLKKTASGDPVPGGGSVSALAGAAAASLVEMVANLTEGRKGFEDVTEEMERVSREAARFRERLSDAIDRDSAAYAGVLDAFHMPKTTDPEKETRSRAIQEGLRLAAEVPLAVARDALEILPLAETVLKKGNPNAFSDGLVGVMMARTAALGALHNVKINLASVEDASYVARVSAEVRQMEAAVMNKEKDILAQAGV
jgi:formiminotetrahydrofolate cyclodeaminase